jgi:hypothetical protein
MATRYALARVAGAQPEAFVMGGVDFGEGAMKSISEGMSEKKMQKYLAWQGATHQEVDEAIDRAKKEPPK